MPAHSPARVSGVALLSVLVLGACGGPPPQPPTAPATKPIVTEPLPARVDLSPVPSPAGLVAFGRAKKPEEALKEIGRWTGLPMPGGEFVSEIMLGEQIGRVVDLSHPIDFAVVFDGKGHSMKPLMALSAGVRSMDEAKAAIAPKGKLEEWNNGAFRVTGLGPPSEEERDAHPCVLAPSVGSAQADNWRDWRRHEFNQQQRYFNRFVRNERRDYRQFRNHHNNWYGNNPRIYGPNRWYGYNRYYNPYW